MRCESCVGLIAGGIVPGGLGCGILIGIPAPILPVAPRRTQGNCWQSLSASRFAAQRGILRVCHRFQAWSHSSKGCGLWEDLAGVLDGEDLRRVILACRAIFVGHLVLQQELRACSASSTSPRVGPPPASPTRCTYFSGTHRTRPLVRGSACGSARPEKNLLDALLPSSVCALHDPRLRAPCRRRSFAECADGLARLSALCSTDAFESRSQLAPHAPLLRCGRPNCSSMNVT